MDIVRVNEAESSIEVSDSKDHVKSAPSFDDDEDITPEYENRIRSYFGLESLGTSEGGHGTFSGTNDAEDDTTEYEERFPLESGQSGHGKSGESPEVGPSSGDTSPFTDEGSDSAPTVRETEETETFREGGRTKIRRRVIREEIIDEEDPGNPNP
jgi:hypothetical protein